MVAPVFHPRKCIRCKGGSSTEGRIWFIDLGFSIVEEFNPQLDGNLYLCNLCVHNVITDINALVSKWNADHAPWDSPDRVAATYQWEKEIDLSGIDATIGREDVGSDGLDNLRDETDDLGVESDYPSPATADELSEPAVLTALEDNDERSSLEHTRGIGLDWS